MSGISPWRSQADEDYYFYIKSDRKMSARVNAIFIYCLSKNFKNINSLCKLLNFKSSSRSLSHKLFDTLHKKKQPHYKIARCKYLSGGGGDFFAANQLGICKNM